MNFNDFSDAFLALPPHAQGILAGVAMFLLCWVIAPKRINLTTGAVKIPDTITLNHKINVSHMSLDLNLATDTMVVDLTTKGGSVVEEEDDDAPQRDLKHQDMAKLLASIMAGHSYLKGIYDEDEDNTEQFIDGVKDTYRDLGSFIKTFRS